MAIVLAPGTIPWSSCSKTYQMKGCGFGGIFFGFIFIFFSFFFFSQKRIFFFSAEKEVKNMAIHNWQSSEGWYFFTSSWYRVLSAISSQHLHMGWPTATFVWEYEVSWDVGLSVPKLGKPGQTYPQSYWGRRVTFSRLGKHRMWE